MNSIPEFDDLDRDGKDQAAGEPDKHLIFNPGLYTVIEGEIAWGVVGTLIAQGFIKVDFKDKHWASRLRSAVEITAQTIHHNSV